jgi:iron complex outermembrane recepter protein
MRQRIAAVPGKRERFAAVLAAAALSGAAAAPALAQGPSSADLADLSLEELANVQITSVSRHAERALDAPASVYVITGEDIRRSGANTLPDALRLAPNLQFARVNAQTYAISARGFNSTVSNKLLVLIDGRTVYTPLFSGVFWDAQDVLLEDVDRIEVISGPGATLWGANAVNGVINVITKRASATQGAMVAAGAGNLEGVAAARQGGTLGEAGTYRVYGKYFNRGNSYRADGTQFPDGLHRGQGGFRTDWGSPANSFTLQGDGYQGKIDQTAPGEASISGANLIGRWNARLASGGQLQVQTYFDNAERDLPGTFAERLDTYDVELLHNLAATGAHSIVWGGGQRVAQDRVTNSRTLAFLPADVTQHWTNVFAQDEVVLSRSTRFTLGAKYERNPYTGWELLPSARLAWKPDAARLVWGALSRSVRAPSRIDRDFFAPAQPPFLLAGGPDFQSEIAKTAEVGYKAQPSARVSYSVSLFRSYYDRLRSVEPAGGGTFVLGNKMEGQTSGLETWGTYQAAKGWRLLAGAVFFHERLRPKSDSGDTNTAAAGNDPANQWQLRSSHDLSSRSEFDLTLRHVAALPNPSVPAYTEVDVRYGWRPRTDMELSLAVENLLDRRHPEFGAQGTRSEIGRGAFARLRWSF